MNVKMDEEIVQETIPSDLATVLGVKRKRDKKAASFTRAFIVNSMRKMTEESLIEKMSHKSVMLEYARTKQEKGKTKRAKGLSAREKRKLKLFDIKPEHQKYELFLPLHNLWKQYIIGMCNGLKPTSNPQILQQKLLKADFHGAILTVVRSKCPSYVGTTGILVQEFKHVFKIITKDNRLKVIPKKNSVFAVEVNGFVSHIYGSKFEYRASERSAKKFKVKGTIDL